MAAPRMAPISFTILLFARYAELLGSARLEASLPAGATVRDAVEWLRTRPGGERLPVALLVARNMTQCSSDTPIAAGDELALLPPLSGG